jgi:membrane protease subunit HflK
VPKARGAAARKIQEAEGYKEQVIAQAQGETNRFSKLLAEYVKAPDVTRKRLYIESMEAVLAETNTVLVDVKGGNNLLYLPIDKMMPHQSSTATLPPTSSQPSSSTDQPQSSQPVAVQEQAVERPSIRSRDARGR